MVHDVAHRDPAARGTTPSRPERRQAIEAAALKIATEIASDWGDDSPEMTAEKIAPDIAANLLNVWDGYEFAKWLESYKHWMGVDARLVEILDGAPAILSSEHRALERAWVAENAVACPFKLGQLVRTNRGDGVVVETPDYSLAEGKVHVRTPDQPSNAACLINFEDAVLLGDGDAKLSSTTGDGPTRNMNTEPSP